MEGISLWAEEIRVSLAVMLGQFVEYLPNLIGALALLLVGWLIARLLRAGGVRLARWFNRFLEARLNADSAIHFRLSNMAIKLLGNLTFWIIVLLFVTAATRVLGLVAFTSWLNQIIEYLPTLLAGGFIVLVGFVLSTLARDLTVATITSTGVAHAELFGRSVQVLVLVTALVLGINQIGIDVTLLTTLIAILAAAIVGSLALAFALGATSFVGNLIGSHYLRQHYHPGQIARMGDIEGEILEFTPVSVVLATSNGRVIVPAKVFNDRATAVIAKVNNDE